MEHSPWLDAELFALVFAKLRVLGFGFVPGRSVIAGLRLSVFVVNSPSTVLTILYLQGTIRGFESAFALEFEFSPLFCIILDVFHNFLVFCVYVVFYITLFSSFFNN